MPVTGLAALSGFLQGFSDSYVHRKEQADAQRRQTNAALAQMLLKHSIEDPDFTPTPEMDKIIDSVYGKQGHGILQNIRENWRSSPQGQAHQQLVQYAREHATGFEGPPQQEPFVEAAKNDPLVALQLYGPQAAQIVARSGSQAADAQFLGNLPGFGGGTAPVSAPSGGGAMPAPTPVASTTPAPTALPTGPRVTRLSARSPSGKYSVTIGDPEGEIASKEAAKRQARLDTPMSPEEDIRAEARDRGLAGPQAREFILSRKAQQKQADVQAGAETRAQVKEAYRRPAVGTQKTLQDIGVVKSIVSRARQALADPELGPEIIRSRGVLSGRAIDLAQKYGFSQGEAKDLWGTLVQQMKILAVQPYLRGVRRYEFIQDAQRHIPQPGEQIELTLEKLKQLDQLTNTYTSVALFFDQPVAKVKADLAAGKLPEQFQSEGEGAAPAPAPSALPGYTGSYGASYTVEGP